MTPVNKSRPRAARTAKSALARQIEEKTKNLVDVSTIPTDRAGIAWDANPRMPGQPIRDLEVVDLIEVEDDDKKGIGSAASAVWWTSRCTSGAGIAAWNKGNPRYTPLGKFAEIAFDGELPSGKEFVDLLGQFAKIEECDWARHMIAALVSPRLFE